MTSSERSLTGAKMTTLDTVVWLGPVCPLLRAVESRLVVHHVYLPQAALHAVQHGIASCVVIDLTLPGLKLPALLEDLHETASAQLSVLALLDASPEDVLVITPLRGIDLYLSHDTPPDKLIYNVRYLAEQAADGARRADYGTLRTRTRQLEGLLQASFALASVKDASEVLGDLHEVARVAVDADDLFVLLTNEDSSDVSDTLGLGVPEAYLQVCRQHLRNQPMDERIAYLADEVLLRELALEGSPTTVRVREAEAAGARSYMRLPMTADNRLLGFVALVSEESNRFNGAHLQLGRLFAAQVATAVRNMQLYLRLNRAEQRQQAIGEVARLIADDLSQETVLQRIVEQAVRLVEGDAGVVLLVQPDRSLMVSAVYNLPTQRLGYRVQPGMGQAGIVALTGRPVVVDDARAWRHDEGDLFESFPADSVLLGVPLIYRGFVLGVLQVTRPKGAPGALQDDEDLLMALAPQAAIAIAKAQLYAAVQQERRQLRAILDQTPAAIVVADAEGYPIIANPLAKLILEQVGAGFEHLRGRRLQDYFREQLGEQTPVLEDGRLTVEVALGSAGEYLVNVAPIGRSDGQIEGYVGVAQDVTEVRRMDRIKSSLNRVLTHDLGNLLMLARNPLELLDEPDLLPGQRQMLREMLIGSMERMESLIKDVMDLEMADTLGQETVMPYQLVNLVRQAVRRSEDEARTRQVALAYHGEGDPPHPLRGHPVLIIQAVDNLVSNAVKFTPPGGAVQVISRVEDDCAVVIVEDTGYGIPADKFTSIFEPFVRVRDQRTRHIRGTGLGLSLVKTFVEAHGGTVTVESELDVGSRFTVRLPLDLPNDANAKPSAVARIDLSALLAKEAIS